MLKPLSIISLSGLLLVSQNLLAQPSSVSETSAIEQSLKQIVPNTSQAKITPTPIPELYQVIVDGQLVYMSKNGRYLISGKLLDLKTRKNLTAQAKTGIIKKALAGLSTKSMIIYPAKGTKKHTITVFSDIDCPYCAKFHQEVPALNKAGIEVRYMPYPRAGIGSASYDKAVSVWCAKNPQKALNTAMLTGKVVAKTCQNSVKADFKTAAKFNVTGTPTLVFDSGEILPGYVPAKQLIKALNTQ